MRSELGDLLDRTAEVCRSMENDLPLAGKVWTLRVEDDEIVFRIRMAGKKVNGVPVKREAPKKSAQPSKKAPKKKGTGQ